MIGVGNFVAMTGGTRNTLYDGLEYDSTVRSLLAEHLLP